MKKVLILFMLASSIGYLTSCNGTSESADKTNIENADGVMPDGKCSKECAKECAGKDGMEMDCNEHFASMDTDSSGEVSLAEFKTHAEANFTEDNEGEGVCSKECMMFDEFNTDGDDKISKEEFIAGHEAMFTKIDTDANGSFNGDEWKAFTTSMHKDEAAAESKCGEGKCGEGKCGGN